MGLGGFCPLPLRLVADELNGLSASQHARLAADLKAAVKTCPFAVLTFTNTAPTYISYTAMHGAGEGVSPTITLPGGGVADVEWEADYEDDYGNRFGVHIRHAITTCSTTFPIGATTEIQSSTKVRVNVKNWSTGVASGVTSVTLVVW